MILQDLERIMNLISNDLTRRSKDLVSFWNFLSHNLTRKNQILYCNLHKILLKILRKIYLLGPHGMIL